jgi:glycosyltransferase involved in cell wall biosynthesis
VRLGVAPREQFDVVPLGLDLGPFAKLDDSAGSELRSGLGIIEEEVVLGFVGRLTEIKRVDLLLQAFARAQRDLPLRLLIVGDGALRGQLEALAGELGITESVEFLGYRRDLPAIAAATDIAVLTSANEGTPVSLIEASAAGRPAVATDVGGVADVVTPQTGVLVEPGNVETLVDAIGELAQDRARCARLGAAARAHALGRYSAERLVGDIEGLYDRLLNVR